MSDSPDVSEGVIDLTPKVKDRNDLAPIENGVADLSEVAERAQLKKRAQEELYSLNLQDQAKQRRSDEAQERIKEDLEEQARIDPLTNLPNRRHFKESVERELRDAQRKPEPRGAFLEFDLDHFKSVNDSRGHDFGDQLLQGVAAWTRDSVRPGDTVGRLGGEEFGIWARDATPEQAVLIATRLQDAIRSRSERTLGITQTISVGIRPLPRFLEDYQTLYSKADQALYVAKEDRDVIAIMEDDGSIHSAISIRNSRGELTESVIYDAPKPKQ